MSRPHPARTALAAAGEALATVAAGLAAALADLFRRRPRGPWPRLGFVGMLEAVALLLLAAGLTAAAMIFVDPLILGLRLRVPAWLATLADRLTDLGYSGMVLWPLGIAIVCVVAAMPRFAARGEDMARRVAASVLARLGFLFLSVGVVGLAVSLVKHFIGRARPMAAFFLSGPDRHLTFDVMVWKSSYASFPSGHATTAFAAAVAFGALFPRLRWPLVALAAVVAVTRVVLGSHYPSDVIAGAVLGTAFALFMVKAFAARRLVFKVDADGRIAPMAGPRARRLGALLCGALASGASPSTAFPSPPAGDAPSAAPTGAADLPAFLKEARS